MADEPLRLTVADAWALPESVLRERFREIAAGNEDAMPDDAPVGLAARAWTMTRAEIVLAVTEHVYWFDAPELRGQRS